MGNLCSKGRHADADEDIHGVEDAQLVEEESVIVVPAFVEQEHKSFRVIQHVKVPSLFELTLDQLCEALTTTTDEREAASNAVLKLRRRHKKQRERVLGGESVTTTARALRSDHNQRPPQARLPNLKLPPALLQIVFERMVESFRLDRRSCGLFANAPLTSLALPRYADVGDSWLDILFSFSSSSSCGGRAMNDVVHSNHHMRQRSCSELLPLPTVAFATDVVETKVEKEDGRAVTSLADTLTNVDLSYGTGLTDAAMVHLSRCKQLKTLNLSHCSNLQSRGIRLLQRQTQLTTLNLDGCKQVNDSVLGMVGSMLMLRDLCLNGCSISSRGLMSLSNLTYLTRFCVGWCSIDVDEKGLTWLPQNTELTELNLAFTGITDFTVVEQLPKLQHLNVSGLHIASKFFTTPVLFPNLYHVNMEKCRVSKIPISFLHWGLRELLLNFTGISASRLFEQLRTLVSMEPSSSSSLHPVEAEMGVESKHSSPTMLPLIRTTSGGPSHLLLLPEDRQTGVSASLVSTAESEASSVMAEALTAYDQEEELFGEEERVYKAHQLRLEKGCRLERFDAEGTKIDDSVLSVLAGCAMLKHLDISDAMCTGTGIANHVSRLTLLEWLDISGSDGVTNGTLESFAKGLPRLRELYCDCSSITDSGMLYLSEIKSLEVVHGFEADISDKGVGHLATLPHLRSIEFCNGNLSNHSLEVLCKCKELRSINVSGNSHIDDHGLVFLLAMPHLTHANLSNTCVSNRGLQFISKLPAMRSLSLFNCASVDVFHFSVDALNRDLTLGLEFKDLGYRKRAETI